MGCGATPKAPAAAANVGSDVPGAKPDSGYKPETTPPAAPAPAPPGKEELPKITVTAPEPKGKRVSVTMGVIDTETMAKIDTTPAFVEKITTDTAAEDDGGPIAGTGLFLRFDPSSSHAAWYREQWKSVQAWKAVPENSTPGKDVMEAYLAWEAEYIKRTIGEAVVPWHIDNLTESLLTKMLQAKGVISATTTVTGITKKCLAEQGSTEDGRLGALSVIFRVGATYDGGEGPASMIYKSLPISADFYMMRGLCKGMRSFALEVEAYNRNCDFFGGISTPVSYFTAFDPEPNRYVLLIEDLGLRVPPVAPGDQLAGMQMNQVSAVKDLFNALAPMHAKWLDKCVAGNITSICKSFDEPFWPVCFPLLFVHAWNELQTKMPAVGREIPAEYAKMMNSMGENWGPFFKMMGDKKEEGKWFLSATLQHADMRLDNMFFNFNEDGSGTLANDAQGKPSLCLIDFQLTTVLTLGFDLAYFFSMSVSAEFRRAHEKSVIESYYQALLANGMDKTEMPYLQFLFHYQISFLGTTAYSLFGANALLEQSARGAELGVIFIDRWLATYLDWNGWAAWEFILSSPTEMPSDERIRELLPKFIQEGL